MFHPMLSNIQKKMVLFANDPSTYQSPFTTTGCVRVCSIKDVVWRGAGYLAQKQSGEDFYDL